jgi:predicted nucleic acid-binding protein
LIAIQRNLPGAREAANKLDQQQNVSTTPISAFEMCLGAYASGRLENINSTIEMLKSLLMLPMDLKSCLEAGKIAAILRGAGEGLDVRDALIAGVVKRHGETLVTRNLRHLSRIDGLKIQKW